MKNRTNFIIAYRLSTIRDADLILVMQYCDSVEQGSHEKLLTKQSAYYELYMNQFKKQEVSGLHDWKRKRLSSKARVSFSS